MKKILTTSFLLFATILVAQDSERCKKIVETTFQAINAKNVATIQNDLANDFTIAGQKGEIAGMVLEKLVKQLNDSVVKYDLISATKTDKLILIYDVVYNRLGKKTSKFTFDKENKILEIELFEMKVKTMKNQTIESATKQLDVTSIPFRLVGKLIAVEVLIDGNQKTFLVDSGSPKTILNNYYFKTIDSEQSKITLGNMQGVNGSIQDMDIVPIKNFDLKGITFENKEFLTMNLQHLATELKAEIYGLIGYDILKNYDLIFDYQDNKLLLLNPDFSSSYVESNFKNSKIHETTIQMMAHIPTIAIKIGKNSYQMGLDTGAESNLIDNKQFDNLKNQCTNIAKDDLIGADGLSKKVTTAQIKNCVISDLQFKKLRTNFNEMSHLNDGYKIKLDGLLGYEILSKYKTLLSYKNSKLIFFE